MYRSYGKRAVATILSAAMVITMAACGASEPEAVNEPTESASYEEITQEPAEQAIICKIKPQ